MQQAVSIPIWDRILLNKVKNAVDKTKSFSSTSIYWLRWLVMKGQLLNVLWFKSGVGNDVLEQSEETKLQCVVKTSSDPSDLNGVSEQCSASHTHTPQPCLDSRYL